MRCVGMDIHKRVIQAAVKNDGDLVLSKRFECSRSAIEEFARDVLQAEDRVAVENTTNTWAIVELLEPFVAEVVVSNPLRTRAIAEAKVKTDKVDAEMLADLLRAGCLPVVWKPDASTRELRRLMSRRAGLVSDRTSFKNRIHAVLHQRLISPPVKTLFSKAGVEWLQQVDLDNLGRDELDASLRLLDAVHAEIDHLEEVLAKVAYEHTGAKLLITLPGVDVVVAISLLAALGDISRFRSGDHAASYLGLTPSVMQSADKCRHGRITKQGSTLTRWMMVQAAQHVARHPGPLGAFFRKIAKRKGRNVAVVATARKMVVIAWHMLRNEEPYRYATPTITAVKLAKLRIKATGKRRKGGTPKGSPRSANYGSGKGTRAVPSLDEVYEKEGVPALQPLADGERRMIEDSGAAEHVERIHTAHRIDRRCGQGDGGGNDPE